MRDTAKEKPVRRRFPGNDRQGGFVKISHQFRRLLRFNRFFVDRLRLGNTRAFAVRIGVGQRTFQTFAAEQDDEPMAFAGLDNDFGVADPSDLPRQERAQLLANLRFNAAGPPIRDDAFVIECAKIRARGDIPAPQSQPQSERLDDAAADLKFNRIIAEQREVARPAAGCDPGCDWNHAALCDTRGDERVDVRGFGGFQRREFILSSGGKVTEAVEHDEGEFRVGFESQIRIESVEVHFQRYFSDGLAASFRFEKSRR